ncbi:hypothetical protein FJY69_06175, partial [candidate division WOR-3 bacterium]|nr:hypothetical protein [candidate division WOR-3 bacterium]
MRLNLLVAFSALFTTAVAQWREATIQMPGTPAPVAAFYHPATGDVYVSGSSRYVSIVDPESCRIAGRIILPQGTPWWGYSSVRNKLYAGMMWDMVYVIDGATNMVIDSVCVSGGATEMCYTPVNDKLYYVDDSWSEIGAITCANDSLVARIDVWEYPTAMLYNPVFNRICIALETDSVAVIDPATD